MSFPTILCVDDERNVLLALRTQLTRHFPDYAIELAESAAEALVLVDELLLKGTTIPLVIADQMMPGMKGDALLVALHAREPRSLKIMLAGQANAADVGNVVNQGSLYRFIAKPWRETDLYCMVNEALRHYDQERELEQSQAALRQSEQRYRALMEGASDAILLANAQGNLVEVNQKAAVLLGYSREELTRLHMSQLHPPAALEAARNHFRHVILQNVSPTLESVVLRKDGSQVPVDITASRVELDGEPFAQGIFRDTSDRKAIEKQLQLTQYSVDNAAEGVLWINLDFSFFYANQAICRMLGYSADELLKMSLSDIDLDWAPETCHAFWEEYQQGSTGFAFESRHQAKDGRIYPVEITGNYHVVAGQAFKFIRVRDISERKRLETELAESEAKFRRLVERGHDLVWAQDSEDRFTYLSPQFQTLFGWEPQEWLGKPSIDLVHPDDLKHREESGKSSREFRHRHRDGHYVWVATAPTLILNADGVVVGRQGILTDISERKQLEAQAQALNQLKDDFLSAVSHELRTPLASIKMAIHMLELSLDQSQSSLVSVCGEAFVAKLFRYLGILQNECGRELNLVNELLELQRLEARGITPEWSTMNLMEWLSSVVVPYEERAASRGLTLHCQVSELLPLLVSDASIVTSVVRELLTNACKYTPPDGTITVQMTQVDTTVQLSVGNSGTMIPPDELPRLFDKFYRSPGCDQWQQGGTGLGLALVKQQVEHLGGQITVRSSPEQTVFTLVLPLHPHCPPTPDSTPLLE